MSRDEPHAFGSSDPFSLGVEEELFLVDPLTGAQIDASDAVLARLGPVRGTVERELHACQIELITDVCATTTEAVHTLADLRAAVLSTGAGVIAAGAHPAAPEGAAEIAQPTGGLHVHVGMPDPDTAIRAFNGLRRHLPVLQALGANSPFRRGHDTGLASIREIAMRGWPRSGVPRAMRDFDDFCTSSSALCRAADVPDYTWFWWKLRPHPRLGTVEIRALDTQTSLEDLGAMVALVHCLARDAATAEPTPGPPAEILDEAAFRAARYGVDAALPDADGRLTAVRDLIEPTLAVASQHARELGCVDEIEAVWRLIEHGGGAGRQRDVHAIGGMGALLRDLTERTTHS
jgi:glutamate---cysteine ligase / carboxylate-amine ligase